MSRLFSELKWLWREEDGFFGIGQGPTKEQKQQYSLEAGLANFATGLGEKELLQSDKFWSSILSGDPNAIAKVLGPEMSAIGKQSGEEAKTAAEFGNRGGGTNALMQTSSERARGAVDQLIANLTGQAGSALGGQGSGLLSLGSSAHGEAFNMASVIQKLKSAKWNDIFKSIGKIAAGVATGGASLAAGEAIGAIGGGGGGGAGSADVRGMEPWSLDTLGAGMDIEGAWGKG